MNTQPKHPQPKRKHKPDGSDVQTTNNSSGSQQIPSKKQKIQKTAMTYEDAFYKRLPNQIIQKVGRQLQTKITGKGFVEDFLQEIWDPEGHTSLEELREQSNKNLSTDTFVEERTLNEVVKNKEHLKTLKKLQQAKSFSTARNRKKLKLFDLPKDDISYNAYLPLNEIWQQYMAELLADVKPKSAENELITFNLTGVNTIETRLLKADLHGAVLTVIRSKCSGFVGVRGILLQETENMFNIVTATDQLKGFLFKLQTHTSAIPKKNNVFSVLLPSIAHAVTIYGNQFCFRSYERSARKFKAKPTIEL